MSSDREKKKPSESKKRYFKNQISISYIKRLPEIDYVINSQNPTREGWPEIGQEVIWRAYIKNWTQSDAEKIEYLWTINGDSVLSGVIDITAKTQSYIDFKWLWTFERHEIELRLENVFLKYPDKKFQGYDHRKDSVENRILYSDALSFAFYVEEGMYDYFREHQHKLAFDSYTFEDWAHRQISRYNNMMHTAISRDTPHGILDRYRIDQIHIVPNETINLSYGDKNNHSVDLQWGVPNKFNIGAFGIFNNYDNLTLTNSYNPFFYDRVVFHELGHARSLIDVYAYDVKHTNNSIIHDSEEFYYQRINIFENGKSIVGTYIPDESTVFKNGMVGLMNTFYDNFDRFSAMAMNTMAGYRAINGNYNAPLNLGKFLLDLPKTNNLKIIDEENSAIPGALIKIFNHSSPYRNYYGKVYDSIPDIEATTNLNGEIILKQDPFNIYREDFYKIATLIVRAEKDGKIGYGFLPAYLFNMEYWRGNTEEGNYYLRIILK